MEDKVTDEALLKRVGRQDREIVQEIRKNEMG